MQTADVQGEGSETWQNRGTAEASRLWVELLHFSACQFTCRAKLVSSLLLPPLAAEALSHLVAQF